MKKICKFNKGVLSLHQQTRKTNIKNLAVMKNIDILNRTIEVLNADEQQILKDCINYGFWGDCGMNFKGGEDAAAYGYCTNDAAEAGHFAGRQRSALFRSIYRKLGFLGHGYGFGENLGYHNDWWGDGSGDMFFIRIREDEDGTRLPSLFEEWARN